MRSGLIRCVIYFAVIGIVSFLLGRALPKGMFRGDRAPFRPFRWENQGRVYEKLGVRRWKDKMLDMSRILPKLMPSKRMPKDAGEADIELMVQETCIAELIHGLLCVAGFGCAAIWRGVGGWVMSLLYLLGNLPYIVIQRYNRPKLMRILQKVQARESVHEKSDHSELRHGTGA